MQKKTRSSRAVTALADQVLSAYPRIYLACHVEHVRRRSTHAALSSHDSSILAHVGADGVPDAASLALHLRIAPSSLSATLKHLESRGYLTSRPRSDDRRKRQLGITPKGKKALRATSVLDAARVRALLECLDDAQREQAVAGLSLLAAAADRMPWPKPKSTHATPGET